MWHNKRGIMVQFLISLLLCLMIFIPACYLVSGIFRTSEQAQDNFSEFVKELDTFAELGQVGEQKSDLLIMDEETAIVYFEKAAQEVVVEVDAKLPNNDYSIHLLKPGQCDDSKNCLCLFRDTDFDTTLFEKVSVIELELKGKITVTPKRVVCTDLDYNLEVETCSIGKGTLVESYTCSDGFMIERALAKKSKVVYSYYEIDRRSVLYFIKEGSDTIRLIGNYGGTNE
ncbi:MAG: hypothetical protein Q7S55_01600 [Nanoarchaeota archaeon]|nr:hypothetical protein [Nanoarchaeota archaeon]